MQNWPIERKIRYEKDLDPDFANAIRTISSGEQLAHYIQCGTCSANYSALTMPTQRVIWKGELVINQKAAT